MIEPLAVSRVLLTNDDGIDAPGLKVLAEVAQNFAHEIWIIAPEHEHSGSSQYVSLGKPVRAWRRSDRIIAIDGTPSDAVALALGYYMQDSPPALVISGVNAGPNLGDDICMSGTVGAALTALMLGIPAIAISQERYNGDKVNWEISRAIVPKLLRYFLSKGWRKGTCLSISIPNRPANEIGGFSWSKQGRGNLEKLAVRRRVSPRQEEYFWIKVDRKQPITLANTDLAHIRRGEVSVTALSLDRSVEINKPSVLFETDERGLSGD